MAAQASTASANRIAGNAPNASLVLGQPDFVSVAANRGATYPNSSSVYNPHGIALDGGKVYVADGHNNRVLIWKTFPSANGQAADGPLAIIPEKCPHIVDQQRTVFEHGEMSAARAVARSR